MLGRIGGDLAMGRIEAQAKNSWGQLRDGGARVEEATRGDFLQGLFWVQQLMVRHMAFPRISLWALAKLTRGASRPWTTYRGLPEIQLALSVHLSAE